MQGSMAKNMVYGKMVKQDIISQWFKRTLYWCVDI